MADLNDVLAANRAAVDALADAGDRAESVWTTPRAPGKWSPSQLIEHVARTLDESAKMVAGQTVRFPRFPAFLRPLVRTAFFNRVIKTGNFPKAKTGKPFDPEAGPATPADGRTRLSEAMGHFEEACRAGNGPKAKVRSLTFGAVSIADFARFVEAHTRHHTRQMPLT